MYIKQIGQSIYISLKRNVKHANFKFINCFNKFKLLYNPTRGVKTKFFYVATHDNHLSNQDWQ